VTRSEIEREIRSITDEITNLYWTFTRTARGKPPVMVRPDLYRRRADLEAELKRRRERARMTKEKKMTEAAAEYLVAPHTHGKLDNQLADLKVELRRVSVSARLSEETTAFAADIWVNGKRVGYAKNDGRGGATSVSFSEPAMRHVVDAFAKPLQPDGYRHLMDPCEWLVDDLLDKHVQKKSDDRFAKKLAKLDASEKISAAALGMAVARYRSGDSWAWIRFPDGKDANEAIAVHAKNHKRVVDEAVIL